MKRRTATVSVLVLCLMAFVLRVGYVVYAKSWREPNTMEHSTIAQCMVLGYGFSFGDWYWFGKTSVQSPPYPAVLAACLWTFCDKHPIYNRFVDLTPGYQAAMVVNCVFSALTVWLTYRLVRALGGTRAMGVIAAGLVTVWPTQIYSCSVVQAIAMITAATTAMMLLFQLGVRTGKVGYWIGFSIVGCLAALTEPVFLPAMALTGLIILAWVKLPLRVRLRNAAILLAAAVCIIGPWSLRNRAVHGAWVPIKNTFWVNVWKGNNDNATGTDRLQITDEVKEIASERMTNTTDIELRSGRIDGARQYDRLSETQKARLMGQDETVREAAFKDFATEWIKANPGKYARLCAVRLGKTLWIDWDNPKSYKLVYVVSRALLQALTLVGLVFAIRQRWAFFFPVLLLGTCLLTYTLTITAARFSIPFEPLQLAWASAFLGSLGGLFGARSSSSSTTPLDSSPQAL